MVRDGYFYGAGFLAVAVLCFLLTTPWLALVPVLLAAFFFWFFRDPNRVIPDGPGLIVSPADGLVTETVRVETPDGPHTRISIFLSVFNVHVNRSPIAGTLTGVEYRKGSFGNAISAESAEKNEQNIVTVSAPGLTVTFKQIAGLLARRIVFNYRAGDTVARGQRVGLIKFGSRVNVLLPVEAELSVRVGDRVRGGASVLAVLATGDQK
jgi:phosphatidylserine decarboxylase